MKILHSPLPVTSARQLSGPPAARPAPGWNSFRALFEQLPWQPGAAHPSKPQPALAQTRSPFSPPGAEMRSQLAQGKPPLEQTRSAAAVNAQGPASSPANGAPLTDQVTSLGQPLDWYSPISSPISLKPLLDAMSRAGLNVNRFSFDELEAATTFPDHPEFDFTTRQVLIRGPNGSGLFDIPLVLRSPFVTLEELRSYGIA